MLAGPEYPVLNLTKFQYTNADLSGGGTKPSETTNGVVSNDSVWYPGGSGPHWLEVQLQTPYPVGSVQLYLG
ncbi:hypothetical protein RMSM_01280 [Rhodopirellula maiorica SM1]|uniref:F5/8 type C domain-containing protein n=1 Tax=Rhodopirellula maiorica SM1 TaxID=1265738 RepID=M5S6K6_9BACT|nr:hypothetical protein RMSM_01280 [Rhodopirellula maiorica SM1]